MAALKFRLQTVTGFGGNSTSLTYRVYGNLIRERCPLKLEIMAAFDHLELNTYVTALKLLSWVGLYLGFGILVPWIMAGAWAQQHKNSIRPRLSELFQHGELGLMSLVLAISVLWDLQKSGYMPLTVALGSVFLVLTGIMSGSVWVESYCRRSTGTQFSSVRAWRDSRSLALLVFSVSVVTEILLDRFGRVVGQ